MTYEDWVRVYPEAARSLSEVSVLPDTVSGKKGREGVSLQNVRVAEAKKGNLLWRNNVGATPVDIDSTCPCCGWKYSVNLGAPVRYGLCNDSKKLNGVFKSADLIGIERVMITSDMVGSVFGRFRSIEVKRAGWIPDGTAGRTAAQKRWADLVNSAGGRASFSTGEIEYEI